MGNNTFGNGKKYSVIPGIYFYTQEYDSYTGVCAVPGKQTALEINWCMSGRMECKMKDGCILYMGEGDLFMSMTDNHADLLEFPLGYYKGIALSVDVELADRSLPEAYKKSGISVSSAAEKFFRGDDCFLLKSNDYISSFFNVIYSAPEDQIQLYIILKTFELILFLSNLEPSLQSPMRIYRKSQVDVIKEVRNFLVSNISKRTTIEQLSSKFCISSTSLKNGFRDVYGKPISSYLKDERMKKAADLLISTDNSIQEISLQIGYENKSKFSTAFREYFGVTPVLFRKNNLKM